MLDRIEQSIHEPLADLTMTAWTSAEPLSYRDREKGRQVSFMKGDRWGGLFDCAWFRFQGTVPPSASGKQIVLLLDLSGELLVVDGRGEPEQGLTTTASFYDFSLGRAGKRVSYPRTKLMPGDIVDVWADAANNDLFGMLQNNGTVQDACIAALYPEREGLFYDYWVLHDLMQQLPPTSARYQKILFALWNAKQALVTFSSEDVARARTHLAVELNKKNGDVSLRFSAAGHAHLDLAWLWPIRESYRKGARTFSHVLTMMEHYPEFRFTASQAQLYQWMKDLYPSLYERVRRAIADGRWEPITASWVEFDTNVPSGESLVRQLLYGKLFARNEFGVDVRTCLLPDSFGYCGALPQLLKKSGVDSFITTKLSWDRFNAYPHHTFFWEGIDGSRVLVHLPPEGTYNSPVSPRVIRNAENEYLDKAVSDDALLIFGIGDGGGGPGVEHIERALRVRNLEGVAPVRMETIREFTQRLDAHRDLYHVWSGELYLACHQGTYTTQGRTKRNNRLMETGLHTLEFLASIAEIEGASSYPAADLERLWKEVLLYQFHDILPGSSITRVYQETDLRYSAMFAEVGTLQGTAVRSILDGIDTGHMTRPVAVFNTLSWDRSAWIRAGEQWLHVSAGALGYSVIDAEGALSTPADVIADAECLESDLLRVEFNADGSIRSIFDKEHSREVVADGGSANRLVVYDDRGDAWDFSWDTVCREAGQFSIVRKDITVDGPCAVMTQHYIFGSSALVQRVILTSGSRRIDFETRADWQETGKMLRALFPLNIRSGEAGCGIQFGHIMRPTHRSTSWEQGQYEVPAHGWIDLSQRNYGVALLKECKYGHRVEGSLLDINLLRSPVYPDPVADRGEHQFTYALFPHSGDHISGGVIPAAYEMNHPLRVELTGPHAGPSPATISLASINAPNVIVESLKKAEDGQGWILRLYEAHGIDSTVRVQFGLPVRHVVSTNLLEEDPVPAVLDGGMVNVPFKPFEIITLKVIL